MHINQTRLFHGALFLASVFLTGCGGGGASPPPSGGASFTVSGSISGFTGGTLVLRNNGETITINGPATNYIFNTAHASGATYNVTVVTQPFGLNCTVSSGSGTITSNVSVPVSCGPGSYTVSVNVSGMIATGLVLQNNSTNNLTIDSDGTYAFTSALLGSSSYWVTVLSSPGQSCNVNSGLGSVNYANVTVSVTCAATTYSIGGTISGLNSLQLKLKNNGGDEISPASGVLAFTFPAKLVSGAAYNVTVSANPSGKTCSASNNTGNVPGANVTNVAVVCSANTWKISGAVTGLTGSGFVLQNNGGNDLNVPAASGVYEFTQIAEGSDYSVTVKTQPSSPAQVCTVAPAGTGISIAANVTADVSCVNAYTISGTISGDPTVAVSGVGPILLNNGGDRLRITALPASGVPVSFTFNTPIADGAAYAVTQLSNGSAPAQDCSAITNGSGTVSGSDVTNVSITCLITSAPVARFAYVTNSKADTNALAPDTVSAYTVAASGVLAAATTPTTASGNEPEAIAVDPAGKFAYVVNKFSDSISAYGIDAGSGALVALADADGGTAGNQTSISTGDSPVSIAVHPSGAYAYVVNQGNGTTSGNTLSVYSLNTSSGALTASDADAASGVQPTIATGTFPYAVAIDPFGKFVYVANYNSNTVWAYTIDEASGALTPVGSPVTAGDGPTSIAVDPTGKCALVTYLASGELKSYTISGTGALSIASTVAAGVGLRSVAIDPDTGQYAYVANTNGTVLAFSVDSSTCAIAAIDADAGIGGPAIAAGTLPRSINVDPSGQFVYVANYTSNDVFVYGIDPGTGALTLLQTIPTGISPTSVTTTQ